MVGKYKIIAILSFLLLNSAVYALPEVDLKITDYPEVVSPKLIYQDIPIVLLINSTFDGYDVSYSNLKVEVISADNRILYQTQMYFSLIEGPQTHTIHIPQSVIKELTSEDGYIIVRTYLNVVFVNPEDGNYVEDKDNVDAVIIKLKEDILEGDIDVVLVSPDIDIIKEFDRKVYSFIIGLKNEGTEEADNVVISLEIIDMFGNRIVKQTNNLRLNSKEYREIRQDVNFGTIDPGYYKLILTVKTDDIIVYKKEHEIVVASENIIPVRLLTKEIIPPQYKKGDLIMIRMLLRNELSREIVLNPEIISTDLNIYRKLSSFTIGPRETKEFKVVIPLSDDLTPGTKEVKIRLWYGPSVYTITEYINIEGDLKEYTTQVVAELYGPNKITINDSTVIDLYVKTYVEDLIPVNIEVSTENVEARPETTSLVIGGEGLTRKIRIYIEKVYGEGKVNVKIVDVGGNVLATKTILVEQATGIGVPIEDDIKQYKDGIYFILALVIIVLLAAIVYWYKKRRLEEQISE